MAESDLEPLARMASLMRGLITIAALLGALSGTAQAADTVMDHSAWDRLLKMHVVDGRVDYRGFQRDRESLNRYVAALAAVQPAQLPSNHARLAFWINAYNACVIVGVLDHAPVQSVKEIPGFFDRLRYPIAGASLTLNEIEANGRALGDWRVHVAVVCAATSCPPLRSEAYRAERLHDQLAEQTRHFLRDREHGLRLDGSTLWVSQIFQWYAKDVLAALPQPAPKRLTPATLWAVVERYLDPPLVAAAHGRKLQLKWLAYDWSLNAQRRAGRP